MAPAASALGYDGSTRVPTRIADARPTAEPLGDWLCDCRQALERVDFAAIRVSRLIEMRTRHATVPTVAARAGEGPRSDRYTDNMCLAEGDAAPSDASGVPWGRRGPRQTGPRVS